MTGLRIVLAALVIFAAGVLTGGAGVGLAGRLRRDRSPGGVGVGSSSAVPDRVAPMPAVSPVPTQGRSNGLSASLARPPGRAQIEAMARWSRELELEASQRQRIDAILERAGVRLRDLWEPVAPQARAEIDAARRQLEQTLTPEQLQRWNEVRRRRASPRPQPAP